MLRNPLLLLAQPGGALVPSLDKIVGIMSGLPRQRMNRLLRLSPRILTMTPYQLAAQFRDMVSALRVTPTELVKILGRDPKLLQVRIDSDALCQSALIRATMSLFRQLSASV